MNKKYRRKEKMNIGGKGGKEARRHFRKVGNVGVADKIKGKPNLVLPPASKKMKKDGFDTFLIVGWSSDTKP